MRKNGILMHLSSLSSSYGIGAMGQTAKDFVDFCKPVDKAIGSCYQFVRPVMEIRRINRIPPLPATHILLI